MKDVKQTSGLGDRIHRVYFVHGVRMTDLKNTLFLNEVGYY